MNEKLAIGTTIYVQEHWTSRIIKSKITGYLENGYNIHYGNMILDRTGKEGDRFIGESSVAFENVCLTAADAFDKSAREEDAQVKEYVAEIYNIEALIRFPLEHCLNGEEYTDYAAIKAYKIKAKELLNIEI